MALIPWTDEFTVNVAEIDNQHRMLVDLINRLHDAMKSGKGREVTAAIVDEMFKYVAFHFETEEGYMVQYGYPQTTIHKAEHKKFIEQATKSKKSLEEGSMLVAMDLMNFLKNWLTNHIMQTDKKYGPFFNSKGLC